VKQDLLALPLREAREQFERAYLLQQLMLCNGKVGLLAKRVGMERTHLYRKLRSLGVETSGKSRRLIVQLTETTAMFTKKMLVAAIAATGLIGAVVHAAEETKRTFGEYTETPCSSAR
jgi:hypothetical protein